MLPTFITAPRTSDNEVVNKQATSSPYENENPTITTDAETASLVSSLSLDEFGLAPAGFRVKSWNKKTFYSDLIHEGLRSMNKTSDNVVMLYESPSSSSHEFSFFNCQAYRFHDYPPSTAPYKTVLGPCRYSMMNGASYPSYLRDGQPPAGLLEHWEAMIPGFKRPSFISEIPECSQVFAYLPCESIKNHVNDPYVHYHLSGKDALHLMTDKTTKLLPCTTLQRPCVVKTTHSMGSKGIFVIRDDEDELEFETFLAESGNPPFVVTEHIEIERNVACHFFIHPSGDITWFGSNENLKNDNGEWEMYDSILNMSDQEHLKEMQLPFVKDVVKYCQSLGFWGFCGIDVLFDKSGKGYLVDVNPRVTGSCPSLMVADLLKDESGFEYGVFRRNGDITFHGSAKQLFDQVLTYNQLNHENVKIVIFAVFEESEKSTKINIGVYGHSLQECKVAVNHFAQPKDL